tara:strand:- start:2575 stop:2709 length:135 start_codon:yes stop_codon:yes gene_type:complete
MCSFSTTPLTWSATLAIHVAMIGIALQHAVFQSFEQACVIFMLT